MAQRWRRTAGCSGSRREAGRTLGCHKGCSTACLRGVRSVFRQYQHAGQSMRFIQPPRQDWPERDCPNP
eukprot:217985-Chlamydomonas_euryale.AAC.1